MTTAGQLPSNVKSIGSFEGEELFEIGLTAASGARARVLSWGATLRDLMVPGPDGALHRGALGFSDLDSYLANPSYLGATCGRVANRIGGGRFSLDGREYALARNERGVTHLHGGARGFSHRPWKIAAVDADTVTFTRTAPDGEEGYPGNLDLSCTYRLLSPGVLRVEMEARSDATTPVNLAHHSYFTLDPGHSSHELTVEIPARSYTALDALKVPTGEIAPVEGTGYDLRTPRRLGDSGITYDINFVLDQPLGGIRFAARVACPRNGRTLEVWTTEPGLQLYDASMLAETDKGLDGLTHGKHAGICLEAQNFPDAVNHPGFPSPWLRPGDVYRQVTEYRFA
ncbi:galactose mutarotase [Ancylobacter sp. Lp-2]|uniref:aldose epimerase family protein n=1 Tax=Ancylobacter sp. Lp-2 TaxID=2881339 RepID=UPI001E4B082D|nr:aldose epimerase family protein [Ancylobacter sp. Lp-2]MCB4767220.1 galactose mutarotase [Ancylobacter sp. Lp-2]